jgi:hypothetical protein
MTEEHPQCHRRAAGRKLPAAPGQGHYSALTDPKDGGEKGTQGAPNAGMSSSPEGLSP